MAKRLVGKNRLTIDEREAIKMKKQN